MAKLPSPSSPSHRETGEAGLAGGGLGPAAQGARAAGIVGKKEGEGSGFDSPLRFWGMGPAGGVSAAAMAAAGVCGHGRRERGRPEVSRHGAREEREGRDPVRPLPWAGARRGGGATGAAAACCSACVRRRCGLGEASWRRRRRSWG